MKSSFRDRVAPRAGAWIETSINRYPFVPDMVAPRAGAWIETSHVTRSRTRFQVAPRAGAWIETLILIVELENNGRVQIILDKIRFEFTAEFLGDDV